MLEQVVAKLRFRLTGAGWFADQYGDSDSGLKYEITQGELDRNLDFEKRKEDEVYKMQHDDMKTKEF